MFESIKNFIQYNKKQKRQKSKIPWIEIKSDKIDDAGNVTLTLDWNDSFVKKLRKAGFEGIADDQVIEGYLYQLFWNKQQEQFLKDQGREIIGRDEDEEENDN